MSDTGHRGREWHFYLDDMIAFAKNVQTYTEGLDQPGFVGNRLVYDAHPAQPGADRRGRHPCS